MTVWPVMSRGGHNRQGKSARGRGAVGNDLRSFLRRELEVVPYSAGSRPMGRFAILSVMTNPTITLGQIAHARSGDKGNRTNIGVLAYTEAGFEWLRTELTAERVAEYFRGLGATKVERFELPRVQALNFVLYNALAGGASQSLRNRHPRKTPRHRDLRPAAAPARKLVRNAGGKWLVVGGSWLEIRNGMRLARIPSH